VLSRGEVVESGTATQILDHPQHPYTRRLVEAIPRGDPSWLAVGR
jgi:peptide/nickel transport system ATP-binding protein